MMTKLKPGSLHTILPAGKVGSAEIRHDSPSRFERLSGAIHGQPLNAETYTRLLINGSVWMTDAEFECQTNAYPLSKLRGDVLIAGLGLGLIILPTLCSPDVKSVTVLERNADVIALVSPTIIAARIIRADAYTWEPPSKAFDAIYFDIWQNVPNGDDLADMKRLAKRYQKALRRNGWMESWCEDIAAGGGRRLRT